MISKSVAFLLADLGVTKTHSRPHVSNDNPFSEAQFKTLKYRPAFPTRFGSIQDARAHCHSFFAWYNAEHHHSGLGLLTPADVHDGLAEQRVAARATVLSAAYATLRRRHEARDPPLRGGMVMYRQSWLAFTVLLVGCATVPLATDEQDNQAKQFKTSMEHSTIYLVRGASEFVLAGSHNVFNVSVDGQGSCPTRC